MHRRSVSTALCSTTTNRKGAGILPSCQGDGCSPAQTALRPLSHTRNGVLLSGQHWDCPAYLVHQKHKNTGVVFFYGWHGNGLLCPLDEALFRRRARPCSGGNGLCGDSAARRSPVCVFLGELSGNPPIGSQQRQTASQACRLSGNPAGAKEGTAERIRSTDRESEAARRECRWRSIP